MNRETQTGGDDLRATEIVQAELVEVGGAWPVGTVKVLIARRDDDHPARTGKEPYGVPSRFGVGTLLIVTAAYGALLALLRVVGWNRAAIVFMLVFISLVGIAQMFLFGSRRPREASILSGVVCLPLLAIAAQALAGMLRRHSGVGAGEIVCTVVAAILFGAPAGYLAGGVVAGVFLIMDAVQQFLGRISEPHRKDRGSRETDSPQ